MSIQVIIVWSALVLGVWLGSRHTGRLYGTVFGGLCAMLWVIFSVSQLTNPEETSSWVMIVLAGVVMTLLGTWSGMEAIIREESLTSSPRLKVEDMFRHLDLSSRPQQWEAMSEVPVQFGLWLDRYRQHIDPWPAFEYYIRSVLTETCAAHEVHAYRILDEQGMILPLGEVSPAKMEECLRVADGVAGWVVRTRQSWYSFVDVEDEDLGTRIEKTPATLAWCFPIVRGEYVVGVVTIGALSLQSRCDQNFLKLLSGIISEQWGCVAEICRARAASVTDHATGLLSRAQFLRQAPLVMEKSRRLSKPVAAAAISVEGLRSLDDQGFWGLRDLALASVGKVLRNRMGSEDCASRFDDSRFVMLWSEDGERHTSQNVAEMTEQIEQVFRDHGKWRREIKVRCGWSSTRSGHPNVQALISEALSNCAAGESVKAEPIEVAI